MRGAANLGCASGGAEHVPERCAQAERDLEAKSSFCDAMCT